MLSAERVDAEFANVSIGSDIMGLGAMLEADEIKRMAERIVEQGTSRDDLVRLFQGYNRETRQKLGAAIIIAGGNADDVSYALHKVSMTEEQQSVFAQFKRGKKLSLAIVVWGIAATASAAASAYHGYKRNDSVGWAIGWFLFGSILPAITPAVALAQGFGKPKG